MGENRNINQLAWGNSHMFNQRSQTQFLYLERFKGVNT